MSFRLVRVKRRADQEPIEALYLPAPDSKRAKEDNDTNFRIFKHVNRNETTEGSFRKTADGAKVVILSDLNDFSSVAEAVLMDSEDSLPKREKVELDSVMSNLSLSAESEYVYDMYRIDLGRYSESDIKDSMVGIVTYEQELVNECEYSDSDFFEDEADSNAEDYYANDYPDEDSYISDYTDDSLGSSFEEAFFDDHADIYEVYSQNSDVSEKFFDETSFDSDCYSNF